MMLNSVWVKAGGLLLAVLLLVVGYQYFNGRSLKSENTALTQERDGLKAAYHEDVGRFKSEALAAREETALANAEKEEYRKRIGNVKVLDQKRQEVEAKYAKAKEELGDCGDDCLRLLAIELCRAGYRSACP